MKCDEDPFVTLVDRAIEVRRHAHAPYSRFPVGAAIWAQGQVFVGCNVENASYPNGICAELNAVGQMISAGVRCPSAIVVAAGPVISPCGMCRQVLAEFSIDMQVRMVGVDTGEETTVCLSDLFPNPFNL